MCLAIAVINVQLLTQTHVCTHAYILTLGLCVQGVCPWRAVLLALFGDCPLVIH